MNIWLKADTSFDSDDALDAFLGQAQGLIILFDAMSRYNY